MPRPKSPGPYVTGPERHRNKWRVRIHQRENDGIRSTRIRSFSTEKEADEFIRAFRVVCKTAGKSIGEAVNEYMQYCKDKGNKTRTMETARWRLTNILDLEAPLVELRAAKAQRLYDAVCESGLSVDSQRTSLIQAKAFGGWCVRAKMMTSNPFDGIEPKGRVNRGKAQMRIDESRKLKEFCLANPSDGALIVLLAGWRGLRASEIVGLKKRDVDDNGTLLWVADRDGKTEAARRRLRIPEWMRAAVARQCEQVTHVDGWLFTVGDDCNKERNAEIGIATRGHRPTSRHRALDFAQNAMAAAGVPVISLHGLRGLFSTLTATDELSGLAKEMGHTSETMTLKHYIDRDALDDAKVGKL
jgi:integrase